MQSETFVVHGATGCLVEEPTTNWKCVWKTILSWKIHSTKYV